MSCETDVSVIYSIYHESCGSGIRFSNVRIFILKRRIAEDFHFYRFYIVISEKGDGWHCLGGKKGNRGRQSVPFQNSKKRGKGTNMQNKIKKVAAGLLTLVMILAALGHGVHAYGEETAAEEKVELYRYITFYDASGGDINDTVGFHVKNVTGVIRGEYIEAPVNEMPEAVNLGETDGYPKVILNYGMNQSRQKDITEECFYEVSSGIVRIPAEYKEEFLTVKSVMSDYSYAYQLLVPEEYRVNKNLPAPLLTYENGPADETDWAVYGVIAGSCNDTEARGDISGYQVGDRITVNRALVQTVARGSTDAEGTLDLYDELGMAAYRTGFGWTGFAVSLDCGEGNPFTNIGNPGTGNAVRTFPGAGQVRLSDYNWIYARCVTDDSDNFSGNGKVTGGHIKIIGKDADGTLTCWLYLERTGPDGQAAQNVGMVFKVHPSGGNIEIYKSSAMPQITEGNQSYSLAGSRIYSISGRNKCGSRKNCDG